MKRFVILLVICPQFLFAQWTGTQTNSDVGIGIYTYPGIKLHVDGLTKLINHGSRNLLIESEDADSWLTFHDPGDQWYSLGIDKSDNGKFKINNGGNVGDASHFAMTNNGFVGIGTSSPETKLHVSNGSIMASDPTYSNINVRMDGTSIPKINFSRWTGAQNHFHNAFVGQFFNSSLGEYSLGLGTGFSTNDDQNYNENIITATLAGKVGIHTNNPKALLDMGLNIGGGSLGTIFGHLAEGDASGDGTFLGVRGYASQPVDVKSFALEHSFYGSINSSIGFNRGGGVTGGFLTFSTDNNSERMRIDTYGNVGIGTTSPDAKLAVKGNIHANEIKVDLLGAVAPDYVFEKDYPLTSLSDLKTYINQNKHLPERPSAKEMEKNGINLKEMNLLLLLKIEELTLHLIEQNQQFIQLKEESKVSDEASAKKMEELTLRLVEIEKRLNKIENE